MMTLSSISLSEELLLRGKYGSLIKEEDILDSNNLHTVLEAFVELNMLQKVEGILKGTKYTSILLEQENKFAYVKIYYLKEKGEYLQAINMAEQNFSNEKGPLPPIQNTRVILLLIECKILIGEIDRIEEILSNCLVNINNISSELYRNFFLSDYYLLFGLYTLKLGEYQKALVQFTNALAKIQTVGNANKAAKILIRLGKLSIYLGKLESANNYFKQALDQWEKGGNMNILANCYLNLGAIQSLYGNYEIAKEYFLNGLEFLQRTNNLLLLMEFNIHLIMNSLENGNIETYNLMINEIPRDKIYISSVKGYDHVLKALLAQSQKNWGIAMNHWHQVIINEGVDFEYQLLAHEALTVIAYQNWLVEKSISTLLLFEDRLDAWEMLSSNDKIIQLSKIYYLRAELALSSPNRFEQTNLLVAEKQLEKSLELANKSGYEIMKRKSSSNLSYVKQLMKDYRDIKPSNSYDEDKSSELDFRKYLQKLKSEFSETNNSLT